MEEVQMDLYKIFLMMAAISILSPGPTVVMTLTNTMKYGFNSAFGGILGSAIAVLVVSVISATGVGALISNSTLALEIIKYIGATYLAYLGFKIWRAPVISLSSEKMKQATGFNLFVKGSMLQLTNPYIIIFFISVVPQFIDSDISYTVQLITLTLSYSILSVVIQSFYALFANSAKGFLASKHGGLIVNKASACAFVFFAIFLFASS